MRFGIISDIHSNYEALKTIYRELCVSGCDRMICLGDIVGYGPSPRECIDFIRDKDIVAIKGNHDHYIGCETVNEDALEISAAAMAAVRWTRNVIDRNHAEWLNSLPFSVVYENIFFMHAAIDTAGGEYWPYIFDAKSAQFHFICQDTPLAFFGHIHVPLLLTSSHDDADGLSVERLQSRKLLFRPGCKYLVNPGSVGQPRHADPRGTAIIYDTVSQEIELIYADYDVDSTCRKIISAGLPQELALMIFRQVLSTS